MKQKESSKPGRGLFRFDTEVPGLDATLCGGLFRGALYLLEGTTGSGKTILANQICFNLARRGEQILFGTLVAESHAKLIDHIRRFTFFDESLVAKRIHYLSLFNSIAELGIAGLRGAVFKAVRDARARLLVMDGFQLVPGTAPSDAEFSRFMLELSSFASTVGCTILLLAPWQGNSPRVEHALVDGLFELHTGSTGLREFREFRVHKARGSDHLSGHHLFRISDRGVSIYPRLASMQWPDPGLLPDSGKRKKFGIPAFDRMLKGGVSSGSVTGLLGPSGSGKTLFGLKFLEEGLRSGEPGVFLGCFESPAVLAQKARHVSINLEGHAQRGALEFLWHAPTDLIMDELGLKLLESVRRIKARRVVIDSLDAFRATAYFPERVNKFIAALASGLRGEGVTTLLIQDTPLSSFGMTERVPELPLVLDNLVLLKILEERLRFRRLLLIPKVRDGDFDCSAHEFRITDRGFDLSPDSATPEGLTPPRARSQARNKRSVR